MTLQGLKKFRVDLLNADTGEMVREGFCTISALSKESAHGKAMRKLGGYTIGLTLKLTEVSL